MDVTLSSHSWGEGSRYSSDASRTGEGADSSLARSKIEVILERRHPYL